MTISSPEREAKKVKIAVDRNPVETSFEKWACDLKKGVEFFFEKRTVGSRTDFFYERSVLEGQRDEGSQAVFHSRFLCFFNFRS